MSRWKHILPLSSLKLSGLHKAGVFFFQTTETPAMRKLWLVLPLGVEKQSCQCTYGTVFSLLVPSAGRLPYCITLIKCLLQFRGLQQIILKKKRSPKVSSRLCALHKISHFQHFCLGATQICVTSQYNILPIRVVIIPILFIESWKKPFLHFINPTLYS